MLISTYRLNFVVNFHGNDKVLIWFSALPLIFVVIIQLLYLYFVVLVRDSFSLEVAPWGLDTWQCCKISPPHFLAGCRKRQLNEGSFCGILRCFLVIFSLCTVLFASVCQVIGCEDRLPKELYCVGWGVKFYSNSNFLEDKKAQPSLTNPREAKACQKLLQFDVLTTLSLTILAYLHSFSCCCVRTLAVSATVFEILTLKAWKSPKFHTLPFFETP